MKNKIQNIFEITDFIDNARWEPNNYFPINYYKEESDLSNNVKLLTHWICYITDRQMPFQNIWDVGGFVFSNLLDKIEKNKIQKTLIIDNFLEPNGENSFFITRERYKKLNNTIKFDDNNKDHFLFVADCSTQENKRLAKYGFKKDSRPYFISRFYPSDYYSIISTLFILQDYDFNLAKYIITLVQYSDSNLIKRILYGLYLLTYFDIKQRKAPELKNFQQLKKNALERKTEVLKILNNKEIFEREFSKFVKSKTIFNQKRAWCSLRDYCKSNYKDIFIECLTDIDRSFINYFFDENKKPKNDLMKQFELPGDVWNNNNIFRDCLFLEYSDNKKTKLNELLRNIYDENCIKIGYPEQFDITFSFVQRMCEQLDNCKICPYGLLKDKKNDFNKLCVADETKYCPVLFTSCNYSMMCKGQDCKLRTISIELAK